MLRGLQAFEAVARHGSYSGAAQELGVTSAAIGQQVRSLEAWTGTVLFQRLGSGSQRLVPTPTARSVLPQLESGLDQIALALSQLRRPSDHLVLTASQAFVSGWLLPRLDRLAASHPQLGVRLEPHGDEDWSAYQCDDRVEFAGKDDGRECAVFRRAQG